MIGMFIIHSVMIATEFIPDARTQEHVSAQKLICSLIVADRWVRLRYRWVRDRWVRDRWVRDRWVRDRWVRDRWVVLAGLDCTFEIQFGWHKCAGFTLGQ